MISSFSCPDLGEDTCGSGWKRLDFGRVASLFNLASSCFAMSGALLIIFSYICFRDFQTGSRKVITFLAVTNFFQAFGCALSSLNYITYVYFNRERVESTDWCYIFDTLCQLQAFITWWASISSFMWTAILALYLYFALVKGTIILVKNLWIPFYVLTMILPVTVMLALLVIGVLGFSPFTVGGGCFVKTIVGDFHIQYSTWSVFSTITLKGIEIAFYFIVSVLFFLIFFQARIPWSSPKVRVVFKAGMKV